MAPPVPTVPPVALITGGTRGIGLGVAAAPAAPYAGVRFVPSRGVSPSDLADHLRLPDVLACGGSWMGAKSLLAARNWPEITRLTAEARSISTAAR